MAQQSINDRIKFVRIRGRIIPIGAKKEFRAAKAITGGKRNKLSLAKIGASTAVGLGGLAAAGRLGKISTTAKVFGRKAKVLNKFAKVLKFSSKALPAIVIGTELTKIDNSTKADEKSRFLNLGSGKGIRNIATGLAAGFAFTRIGKRFEVFGKRGFKKFPISLKDV